MKAGHKRLVECKKQYELRCREEVQANHQFHQEVSRAGRESAAADRAHAKHGKAAAGLEAAEEAYKASVEAAEEARASWQVKKFIRKTETLSKVQSLPSLFAERDGGSC